ncbi:MAG: hypothetical protein ABI271_07485, partial [Nitrosospira sp.]
MIVGRRLITWSHLYKERALFPPFRERGSGNVEHVQFQPGRFPLSMRVVRLMDPPGHSGVAKQRLDTFH